MKRILLAFQLLSFAAFSQDGGQSFKLEGRLNHLPDSLQPEWVYLQYRVNGETKSDSVQPTNGKYVFTGMISEPVVARLRVKYAELNNRRPALNAKRDAVSFFMETGKQRIAATDSFSNIKVKGSAAQVEYAKLNNTGKPFDDKRQLLIARYVEYGKAKDKVNQDKIEAEIDALDLERSEKVFGEYVKSNPRSPIAMYALQQYAGWDIDADKVEPLFKQLPEKFRKYPSGVAFAENLEIAKKTGIGKMAMDFTQNDTLGKAVTMSSFRGRYLLIDFWASWCGPCRAENPNVVKVFNKYKDRNFHIIGVSLDRPGQQEKWLKAIHDDGLAWTHVSDLKYWDNEVAKEYGIRAIPQNLLLDPDGRIIAKNLRGEDLEQKLGEAYGEKKGF